MEKVWGPIKGFYITAYSMPVGTGERFCSYAKVCPEKPATYWDASCVFKLFGGEDHKSAIEALAFARLAAQAQIERIPARELALLGFAVMDSNRQICFPLAPALAQRAAA